MNPTRERPLFIMGPQESTEYTVLINLRREVQEIPNLNLLFLVRQFQHFFSRRQTEQTVRCIENFSPSVLFQNHSPSKKRSHMVVTRKSVIPSSEDTTTNASHTCVIWEKSPLRHIIIPFAVNSETTPNASLSPATYVGPCVAADDYRL